MLSNVVVDQYADMIAGLLLHDLGVKLGFLSQIVKYVMFATYLWRVLKSKCYEIWTIITTL